MYHHGREGLCDGLPLLELPFLFLNTSHKADAVLRVCHGCVSKLCHTFVWLRGHGQIFHSVGSLGVRVPHRTFLLSAWDIRDENMVALVSSAFFHLTFVHKKSPRRISPTKALYYFFSLYSITQTLTPLNST